MSYLQKSTADIFFVFETDDGKIERVPCHKSVLIRQSDIFRAMLSGYWQENCEIKIVDVSAATSREFLRLFYSNTIQLTAETVEGVFYLIQKYMVKNWIDAFVQYLTDNLTPDNVCFAYAVSIYHGREELKKCCEMVIGLNTAAVLKSSDFLNCNDETLSRILKLDTLSCPEYIVFRACMAWLQTASNRKTIDKELVEQYLGESFQNIRFGIMTIAQVNVIFRSHKNLFTTEERTGIIRMVNGL